MKNKLNVFSGVFCAVVVLACLICYSGYVSQLYFDVCTPYAYSPIAGCEGIRLDGMPEGYLIPDYMAVDDPEEMEAVSYTHLIHPRGVCRFHQFLVMFLHQTADLVSRRPHEIHGYIVVHKVDDGS